MSLRSLFTHGPLLIPCGAVLTMLIPPGCSGQSRPDRTPGGQRERVREISEQIDRLLQRPRALYIPVKVGQQMQCIPFRLQRQPQGLDPPDLPEERHHVLIRLRPTSDGSRLRYQISTFEPAKIEVAGPWFERPDGRSGRATCAAEYFVIRLDREEIVLVQSFDPTLAGEDLEAAEVWFFDRRRCVEQLPRSRPASFCQ